MQVGTAARKPLVISQQFAVGTQRRSLRKIVPSAAGTRWSFDRTLNPYLKLSTDAVALNLNSKLLRSRARCGNYVR